MSDLNRARELANAAATGHWPSYLLALDEDKLYATGRALVDVLEQVEDDDEVADEQADQIEELKDSVADLEEKVEERDETILDLKEKIVELKAKLA